MCVCVCVKGQHQSHIAPVVGEKLECVRLSTLQPTPLFSVNPSQEIQLRLPSPSRQP